MELVQKLCKLYPFFQEMTTALYSLFIFEIMEPGIHELPL